MPPGQRVILASGKHGRILQADKTYIAVAIPGEGIVTLKRDKSGEFKPPKPQLAEKMAR